MNDKSIVQLAKSGKWEELASLNDFSGIDEKDELGMTALMYAVIANNQDAVIFLLEEGASLEIKNNDGDSPLDIAKEKRLADIVKYFEKKMGKIRTNIKNIQRTNKETKTIKKHFKGLIKQENFNTDPIFQLFEILGWISFILGLISILYIFIDISEEEQLLYIPLAMYSGNTGLIVALISRVGKKLK
ncbi:MAG: ankyrin repeat domain-containing protein [Promethearchaeota archaeon]